jgi:ABC-type antimicrobial peptide transport system permease subunit
MAGSAAYLRLEKGKHHVCLARSMKSSKLPAQQQIDAAVASERSFASVTSGFGILAVLLASIGVYGVIAAGVARRINEIGVRMALGARAAQVLRMVMGETLDLVP